MKTRDIFELLLLAALWGASFLFMRVATPEFGPVALIEIRVVIAALFLLPILAVRTGIGALKAHWGHVFAVGALNSAFPFCLLAFSTLYLTGGFAAIVNATSPLFAGIVAWFWLGDKLNSSRIAGLVIGFGGVVILVWNKISFQLDGAALAIPAAILASLFYGVAANYTKKNLSSANSLAVATGSQIGASILLLPGAILLWPENSISAQAWASVIVMGIASTGIAYILYFRLIAHVGPAKAITVTFLVPAFAVLWGAIFIDEHLTTNMVFGSAVILTGTALATGLIALRKSR